MTALIDRWMRWQTPRRRLLLAVAFGSVVALCSGAYQRSERRRFEAQYQMASVLVVKKYLGRGRQLSSAFVQERAIPARYIEPTAVRSLTELKSENGEFPYAALDLMKGEQLTRSKLLGERGSGLAASLPSASLAISFRFRMEDAVSGWVQPGDWVVVLSPRDAAARTILVPRAQVLAVGRRRWDRERSAEANDLEDNEGTIVTLNLGLEDVARLTVESEKGRLVLALLPALPSDAVSQPSTSSPR